MSTVVSLTFPNGGISDSDVAPSANIDSAKLISRKALSVELFAEGATITALASKLLHIFQQAGTLLSVEAIITTQATGADRTVDVAIQKSTGAGAFATIMSANVAITNSTPVRTPVAGSFSNSLVVDGDILRAVVTVAGSAGAQAQGLLLTLYFDENPG